MNGNLLQRGYRTTNSEELLVDVAGLSDGSGGTPASGVVALSESILSFLETGSEFGVENDNLASIAAKTEEQAQWQSEVNAALEVIFRVLRRLELVR